MLLTSHLPNILPTLGRGNLPTPQEAELHFELLCIKVCTSSLITIMIIIVLVIIMIITLVGQAEELWAA